MTELEMCLSYFVVVYIRITKMPKAQAREILSIQRMYA